MPSALNKQPVIIGNATLYCGDCVEVLKTLPDNSIEACLTDPPYGLSAHSEADIRRCIAAWLADKPYEHGKAGFMGKEWDSFVPGPEMWKELYRVLKPGAHLLVFAGTRTADLMSLALRLAGFECKETIMWTFGSGFPKASDISKNIDKMKGAEREVVGIDKKKWRNVSNHDQKTYSNFRQSDADNKASITAPATPEAAQWEGWKSALKPCYEPILLFRKPLDGTIAETVLKWGTGGLNVGVCRVESGDSEPNARDRKTIAQKTVDNAIYNGGWLGTGDGWNGQQGRYPGNLIVSSDEEVERCFPVTVESKQSFRGLQHSGRRGGLGDIGGNIKADTNSIRGHNDTGGSASRFFQHCDYSLEEIAELNGIEARRVVYSGKASKRDRDEGCEGMEERGAMDFIGSGIDGRGNAYETQPRHNHHPTCKPTSLLRYCLKLICPPGATVIDPFFGSGSTGKAALLEGFKVIGIEREAEYFDIAVARCAHVSPEAYTVQPTPRKETAAVQGTLL